MAWVALVAFGKWEKWPDLGDILEGDLIEFDTWLVLRNKEEDGIEHNFQVPGPNHHPRISSFQGRAEGKRSKKLTKREWSKVKNKEDLMPRERIFREKSGQYC